MLSPVTLEGFSGLRLDADVDELGANGCVDGSDFVVRPGRVRQRYGYSQNNTVAAAPAARSLLLAGDQTNPQLIATGASNFAQPVYRFEQDGTSATYASATQVFGGVLYNAPGAPSVAYLPSGTAPSTIAKMDGTFSDVAISGDYNSSFITTQSPDNRLVLANGGTGAETRVRFSDPGDPAVYGANNYEDLIVGGGDEITALTSFRGQVYAFKSGCYAVFYGNSTDSAGEPIFNQRLEDHGVGASGYGACVATPDGVYFAHKTGVYLTTGGPPTKVSQPIDPLFTGEAVPFFSGAIAHSNEPFYNFGQLGWHNGELYVPVRLTAANVNPDHTLVYNSAQGWSIWNVPARSFASGSFSTSDTQATLYFGYGDGTDVDGPSSIGRYHPSQTTDAGTAISSYYRSGLYDLGTSNDKVIHHSEVHGIGTVGFSTASDRDAFPTARTLTLGTAPVSDRAYDSYAPRPSEFVSYRLSSVSGAAWQVDRITHYLRPSRATGLRAA